jgi:NitT/TauT family transport system ATP-binding protein
MQDGVVIDGVSRSYATKGRVVHALGPPSVRLKPGRTTAIVGPSGCGKSTLLRIVAGLERPTAGLVLARGTKVRAGMDGVGIVFQRDLLMDWRNVLANVLLPAELQRPGLAARAQDRQHAGRVGRAGTRGVPAR